MMSALLLARGRLWRINEDSSGDVVSFRGAPLCESKVRDFRGGGVWPPASTLRLRCQRGLAKVGTCLMGLEAFMRLCHEGLGRGPL